MPFEVEIGVGPEAKDTKSVGRYATLEEAITVANRYALDTYIFQWVTERTRLICWHSIAFNRH